MGFSFRLLYVWLVERGWLDRDMKEDDFINHAVNGYTATLLVNAYEDARKQDRKIKELEDKLEISTNALVYYDQVHRLNWAIDFNKLSVVANDALMEIKK